MHYSCHTFLNQFGEGRIACGNYGIYAQYTGLAGNPLIIGIRIKIQIKKIHHSNLNN